MKKKLLGIVGLFGLIFFSFSVFSLGHAQEFRHGNSATVGTKEVIDSSAYLAGRHLDIAGRINGDLFCAGQNINVSGTVAGDIICAGQNITITGLVEGDVRVAAQTVVVSSQINGNLTVAGQDLVLNSSSKVGGDITGGVNSMIINGTVGRDMVLGATEANINGSVGRNIKSTVENLNLGSTAKVGGSIEYTSDNQLKRAEGAEVTGNIQRTQPEPREAGSGWFGIGFRVYWFLAMLLVALALILLFPSIFQAAAERTMASLGRTLLLGVAATLITPFVVALLMVTIVGIPLGIILLLGWILALFLSGPFFAYLLGKEIWRGQHNRVYTMLLGAVILLLVYNIPYLGFIAMIAALFMGMGMIVRELTHHTPKPAYRTIENNKKRKQ